MYKYMKKKFVYIIVLCIIAICSLWIAYENTALEVNEYSIASENIPDAFDGYRIAHVSDLHNAEFGEGNANLLNILRTMRPDMIAITGDLIDSRNTNIEIALEFAKEAMEIAPCYYVTGNHEARVSEYENLKQGMEALGIIILEDKKIELERENEYITLFGVDDPDFNDDYLNMEESVLIESRLEEMISDEDGYRILLSHRPELFSVYEKYDMDLVLSGHAHGGQFRLPFVGGILAPHQGFFPKYDAGLFEENGTALIVSRGIGNSLFPFRVNNPPEVILVELNVK